MSPTEMQRKRELLEELCAESPAATYLRDMVTHYLMSCRSAGHLHDATSLANDERRVMQIIRLAGAIAIDAREGKANRKK